MGGNAHKKLQLIVFKMCEQWCNAVHKNNLSNKVQDLNFVDASILLLLQINVAELTPHQQRLFYTPPAEIFSQTPNFWKEWEIIARHIYKFHFEHLADPATHSNAIHVICRWLKILPRPTCVVPNDTPTTTTDTKHQRSII